mmetsp:Transcript_27674/g.59583  ORF Transcript_27674/g.59583 Transcript_27674/m.59583 type:complete len:89 (-) Transcript_27674:44-310(-)
MWQAAWRSQHLLRRRLRRRLLPWEDAPSLGSSRQAFNCKNERSGGSCHNFARGGAKACQFRHREKRVAEASADDLEVEVVKKGKKGKK